MRRKKQPKTEEIGIRELKSRASEVVRAVKEERARYVVTQRGKPVAAIIPMDAMLPEKKDDDGWENLMAIRARLGKDKKNKKSSLEILSEMRR
ncbi:MAG TPA: type II toxin-antitoxin system Phd/YefM family antitoxin [Anaerolineales bacterium]|jgi:prevent-host-death family protein|nr:type II toxin-antitoxin system Phd/YefM family antitoxin [Anaerolineales bacterium]